MNADVARAEQAVLERGLTLEWDDEEFVAPGLSPRRVVRVVVKRGREILSRAASTYGDEASKKRALCFCAESVFFRP